MIAILRGMAFGIKRKGGSIQVVDSAADRIGKMTWSHVSRDRFRK